VLLKSIQKHVLFSRCCHFTLIEAETVVFGNQRNPDRAGFAAFGKVIEGMDVVQKIHQSPAKEQTLEPSIAITHVRFGSN